MSDFFFLSLRINCLELNRLREDLADNTTCDSHNSITFEESNDMIGFTPNRKDIIDIAHLSINIGILHHLIADSQDGFHLLIYVSLFFLTDEILVSLTENLHITAHTFQIEEFHRGKIFQFNGKHDVLDVVG